MDKLEDDEKPHESGKRVRRSTTDEDAKNQIEEVFDDSKSREEEERLVEIGRRCIWRKVGEKKKTSKGWSAMVCRDKIFSVDAAPMIGIGINNGKINLYEFKVEKKNENENENEEAADSLRDGEERKYSLKRVKKWNLEMKGTAPITAIKVGNLHGFHANELIVGTATGQLAIV